MRLFHHLNNNKMKKVVFLAITMASMLVGGVSAQQDGIQRQQSTVASKQASGSEIKRVQTTLDVQGACGMCKTRIEKVTKGIAGVTVSQWELKTNTLSATYDPAKTSPDAICKAVADAGHDAGKYKADNKVYNALPGC